MSKRKKSRMWCNPIRYLFSRIWWEMFYSLDVPPGETYWGQCYMKKKRAGKIKFKTEEFYWDRDTTKPIFVKHAGGVRKVKRDLFFVFNSIDDLIKFLLADSNTVIYRGDRDLFRVGPLRTEMEKRGVIFIRKYSWPFRLKE